MGQCCLKVDVASPLRECRRGRAKCCGQRRCRRPVGARRSAASISLSDMSDLREPAPSVSPASSCHGGKSRGAARGPGRACASSRRSVLSRRPKLRRRSSRSRCAPRSASSANRARRWDESVSRDPGVEAPFETVSRPRSPLSPVGASAEPRPEEADRQGVDSSGATDGSSSSSPRSERRRSRLGRRGRRRPYSS